MKYLLMCAATVALMSATSACDSAIYDGEDDCAVKVSFRYDRNIKFADAFAAEVGAVSLYVFDAQTGVLVEQVHDNNADRVGNAGYALRLDNLDEGRYRFLAWAGAGKDESFDIPQATVGVTTEAQLTAALRRQRDTPTSVAYSKNSLSGLYHGVTEQQIDYRGSEQSRRVVVDLTKDTNHLRVILQQLSGEGMDPAQFVLSVTDQNGFLSAANLPQPDETIEYRPYAQYSASAGVDTDPKGAPSREITSVAATVADIDMSRLMEGAPCYLSVKRADTGESVLRIPVTDYALMVKGNYAHPMTDQEYLDRQDEYAMTFFLDADLKWLSASILINSWRVVLNSGDLQ